MDSCTRASGRSAGMTGGDACPHPRARKDLQALRRRRHRRRTSTSRSRRARRSASSGRTAPARPRCSASPPAPWRPTPDACCSTAATSRALAPERRCRLGIARSFQIPQPFGGMTVFENLVVAAAFGSGRRERDVYGDCAEVLDRCGLADKANRPAGALTLLDRKRLELARALATRPRVLLLDEVAGGLDRARVRRAGRPDRAVRATGVSIVWIEHVVHALIAVVDRLRRAARRHASSPRAIRTRSSAARRSPRSTWGFRPMPEAARREAMDITEANDLLEPGYLPFESGYRDLGDGRKVVAALTRMPGCRARMVHWWFSWLGGTDQYKLWHPTRSPVQRLGEPHRRQVHRWRPPGARISRRAERADLQAAHRLS